MAQVEAKPLQETEHAPCSTGQDINELMSIAEQATPHITYTEYTLQFIEAAGNMFFYLLALFIVIVPPLKWLGDLFSGEETTLMFVAAIIVFVFLVPSLTPVVINYLVNSMEKIKKGEWLGPLFRPLRAICAVISLYGILMLEYKIIHGHESKSLFEVYWELIKSL